MATRLENNDLPLGRGLPKLYPWEEWADGAWWEIEEGEDYTCKAESFRTAAYKWGRRNGYHVETQLPPWGGVRVRFRPRSEYGYSDPDSDGFVPSEHREPKDRWKVIGPPVREGRDE